MNWIQRRVRCRSSVLGCLGPLKKLSRTIVECKLPSVTCPSLPNVYQLKVLDAMRHRKSIVAFFRHIFRLLCEHSVGPNHRSDLLSTLLNTRMVYQKEIMLSTGFLIDKTTFAVFFPFQDYNYFPYALKLLHIIVTVNHTEAPQKQIFQTESKNFRAGVIPEVEAVRCAIKATTTMIQCHQVLVPSTLI